MERRARSPNTTSPLVEGIADQIGTALERDQLSAEVLRLKSELHQNSTARSSARPRDPARDRACVERR
ncbi:MAG: hypothetical protein IPG22_00010 [Acidobacteria bacterium]|nr:hypothetical protein [Acidobacteriota bacterium]